MLPMCSKCGDTGYVKYEVKSLRVEDLGVTYPDMMAPCNCMFPQQIKILHRANVINGAGDYLTLDAEVEDQ